MFNYAKQSIAPNKGWKQMSEQEKEPPKPQPRQKRINIDLPKDLKPVYANVALISHSMAEIVLDLAQVLPRSPRGSVQTRVVMTPMHAKMLQIALAHNLANYERQYGEIALPQRGTALANSFFSFPQDDPDDDKDKDKDPDKDDKE
jgi:hypothetical protein